MRPSTPRADGYRPARPPLARTLAEAAAYARTGPPSPGLMDRLVAAAPRGDGHAVLLLPPIFRDDPFMAFARLFLSRLGYAAYGWGLGFNLGPTRTLTSGALARLTDIARKHGKVSLFGVSMGGLFARWLATRRPDLVRQVITAGSPFRASSESAFLPLGRLIELWQGPATHAMALEIERPPPVPTTSIYSRNDGIVAWTSCFDPALPDEAVEVTSPHVLMARDPDVLRIVASRLARDDPRRS